MMLSKPPQVARAAVVVALLALRAASPAQPLHPDIPYVTDGHERQVLDVYTPETPAQAPLPAVFWIHGGGWVAGDKQDVALKPRCFTGREFVFVSTNYRLLPEVEMGVLIRDVAKALA